MTKKKPFNKKLFGQRVRDLRKKCGYTQEELAAELGVVRATVGLIELGNNLPSINLLMDIVKVADSKGHTVTLDYLCGLSVSSNTVEELNDLKVKHEAVEKSYRLMEDLISAQKKLLKG